MAFLEYLTTDRDRICKLCLNRIARGAPALVMRDVHVSPKLRDLHFHETCFRQALMTADDDRAQRLLRLEP